MDESLRVQGAIFDNVNFFIVQRVPQRSHYVSLVENHGGRVVRLEAQADYLIADHMRQDAPPGSFSYKFIEAAVKEGNVPEDGSSYLIGPPKSANPVTTTIKSSSKKATRTPFTNDDDKLLYKWVQKASDSRLALQGNKIYQILAAHNDRHTYQSWRDRYVKTLSSRPPSGWEEYPDENLSSLVPAIIDLPSTALPRSTPVVRPSASPTKSLPRAREKFTAEDDQELIALVRKAHNRGEPVLGNKLYENLAARNPRHTYQSWRGRWVDVLQHTVHLDEGDSVKDDDPVGEDIPVGDDASAAQPSHSPEILISRPPVKRAVFRIPPASSASAASPVNGTPKSTTPHSVATAFEPPLDSISASASRPTASRDKSTARATPQTLTKSPSQPITSPLVAVTEDQANIPVAETRSISPPVTSQHQKSRLPQSQQPQSRSPLNGKPAQVDLRPPSYDDSKFTKVDYNNLLESALDIQNVRVGRYQESWISFAKAFPKCTAVEWRAFYERSILPVVLQKGEDIEFSKGQPNGEWVRFWQNQGQPIETLPYVKKSAAPEKRNAPVEVAESEDETTPRASKALMLNQDENMADTANTSAKRMARESGDFETAPAKRRRTQSQVAAPVEPPLSSRPSQQAVAEVISISDNDPPSSSFLTDEEETLHQVEAAQQLRREMEETSRHQLTRANLARIQHQNGFADDGENRGVDLEEDDGDDDQANFIDVLGSLLPPGLKERAMEAAEARTHQADEESYHDDDDAIMQEQPMEERVYDPALLESSPECEPNPYQSSAEFLADDSQMQLDPPETQPWEDSSAPSQPQQRTRLNTQAIYDAETQPFDHELPAPPSEFDNEEHTPFVNTDSQVLTDDELWPWVDSQVALGYSEEVVKEALRATSLNPKLAKHVLEARGGRTNLAGVWTEEEDEIVEGRDANAMRVLEKKHGIGSVIARLRFLDEWRQDEEVARAAEDGGE